MENIEKEVAFVGRLSKNWHSFGQISQSLLERIMVSEDKLNSLEENFDCYSSKLSGKSKSSVIQSYNNLLKLKHFLKNKDTLFANNLDDI